MPRKAQTTKHTQIEKRTEGGGALRDCRQRVHGGGRQGLATVLSLDMKCFREAVGSRMLFQCEKRFLLSCGKMLEIMSEAQGNTDGGTD